MDLFTRDDLRALLTNQQKPCLSVFLPTTRGAKMEDSRRLRSHLQAAGVSLAEEVRRSTDVRDLLRPAEALLDDVPFWRDVSDSLALFLAPQTAHCYRLPLSVSDQVVVGKHFHIKPLVPLLNGQGRFYLLTLSRRGVHLIQGTQHTAQEVDLHHPPAGQTAPRWDGNGWSTVTAPGNPDGQEALIPGPGVLLGGPSKDIVNYFHAVDRGLQRILQHDQAPLALAGDEDLIELYRQANSYRQLVPETVSGHPDRMSPRELQESAWATLRSYFSTAQEKVAGLYRQLAGTGRTADNLADVVAAAYQGQLQYLFAALGRMQWGTFDPATLKVETHEREQIGDEDLINVAAFYTLAHGGNVYAVDPERVPSNSVVAAIYRLPIGSAAASRWSRRARG